MKLISLTENGKPILINPDHIMFIGKGVNHAGQEVDMIVLSSGMSVKPDNLGAGVLHGFTEDEAKVMWGAVCPDRKWK